jgi:predicted Zn-dependent protease
MQLPPGTASISDRNPESHSRDLFKLFVIAIGTLIALIWSIFALAGAIVWWLPPSVEQQLGRAIIPLYERQAQPGETQTRLNELLHQLEMHLPKTNPPRDYQSLYINDPTVNAAAIPGDRILVYQGLLDQTESENELMMVLGHELGHFSNRDHLRGLGNALLLQIAFSSLFGDIGSIAAIGTSSLEAISRAQFSQQQETQADEVGLTLLYDHYNHAAGATDFFDRIRQRNRGDIALLASHPAPASRVEHLQQLIRDRHYPSRAKKPLTLPKPSPKPSTPSK